MASITVKDEGAVRYITLNRPEVFNSFNREMALHFQQELDRCHMEESVRAVVVQAEGKAFCAGQDLVEVRDPEGPALTAIVRDHYNPIIEKIRSLPKPVIAAVNGVAAGAGANIALACDMVVAAKSAAFIQAFSKIGLIPDSGGTYFLPRLIGLPKATAMMMLGEKISAEQAEQLGMIYKVVEDDQFSETVKDLAAHLADMPTRALALTKMLLNESHTNTLTAQLMLEEQFQTKAGATEDYAEGVAAFIEKRKPRFKGY